MTEREALRILFVNAAENCRRTTSRKMAVAVALECRRVSAAIARLHVRATGVPLGLEDCREYGLPFPEHVRRRGAHARRKRRQFDD